MSDIEQRNTAFNSACTEYGVSGKPEQFKMGFDRGFKSGWKSAKQDVGEWVKTSDRLPPFNTPVFAGHFYNGKFSFSEYVITDDADGWLWSRVYGDDDWHCDDDYSSLSHWMHKPQSPKEKS